MSVGNRSRSRACAQLGHRLAESVDIINNVRLGPLEMNLLRVRVRDPDRLGKNLFPFLLADQMNFESFHGSFIISRFPVSRQAIPAGPLPGEEVGRGHGMTNRTPQIGKLSVNFG